MAKGGLDFVLIKLLRVGATFYLCEKLDSINFFYAVGLDRRSK